MILEKLDIFGIRPADEKMILSTMALGDPILLIGEHGSAKTEIAKQLAGALLEYSKKQNPISEQDAATYEQYGTLPKNWTQSATYDCSKMQFEEIIGFPNPSTFESGFVDYVQSPITIWDKRIVILDEFNRQSKRQQNSLFELIRSRTIYGRPTGTKVIFACMNPFGMEGTEILDEALVDRMGCFVYTDGFDKLDDIVREEIITRTGISDSPGLRYWNYDSHKFDSSPIEINNDLASIGHLLDKIIRRTAVVYKEQEKDVGESYALFVNRFISFLYDKMKNRDWEISISSRRAGMIYRSLLGYRSIEIALSEVLGSEVAGIRESFSDVVIRTLPVGISESGGVVSENVETCMRGIIATMESFFVPGDYKMVRSNLDILHELLTTSDMVRKVALLIDYTPDNFVLQSQIWDEITTCSVVDDTSRTSNIIETKEIQSMVLGVVLANLVSYDNKLIPESIAGKVVSNYSTISNKCVALSKAINIKGRNILVAPLITKNIEQYEMPLEALYASLLWKSYIDSSASAKRDLTEDDIIQHSMEVISSQILKLRDVIQKLTSTIGQGAPCKTD